MSYDPISWIDRRVTKVEGDLSEAMSEISTLKRWRDNAAMWVKIILIIGMVAINLKRESALDILNALTAVLK